MAHSSPRRILVTGASGFVGQHLLPALAERYPDAILHTISLHPHPEGHPSVPGVRALLGDIRDTAAVRAAVREAQPDLIFHLAGQASVAEAWADPGSSLAVNAGGAIGLLEAVRAEAPTARVLLIGSGEEYGPVAPQENPLSEERPLNPANPYAVSKAAQEMIGRQYAMAYGMDVICVRAFNHFGPYQSDQFVIASFARQIAQAERETPPATIRVGNLTAQRDFLPVRDVIAAYIALVERARAGEVYNVGSGIPRTIASVSEALLSLASCHPHVEVDPSRLRPVDVPLAYANIAKITRDTGWSPRSDFTQALADVLDYWRTLIPARARQP